MSRSAASSSQTSGLTKHQTRSTIAFLNWNTGLRSVFATVASPGSFIFTAFVLKMGVEKEQMGWIAFMASAACLMQMAGLMLSNHVRDKKRMVIRLSMAEPLLLLAAVLIVPFLAAGWRLPGLMVATFASAAVLNLTRPLSDDWTASAVPAGLRESFLGRRSQIMSMIAIGALLATGFAADYVRQWGSTGLAALLAIGAVIGVLAAIPLRHAMLPSITARASVTLTDVKGVLLDRYFQRYLLVIMLIEVPFFLASPYYQVFHLEVLHLSATKIAYLGIGYQLIKLLISGIGARWVSRFGASRMLQAVVFVYIFFFGCYLLTADGSSWPVYLGWVLAGIGDAIFGIAQGTALFKVIPHTPARSAYFAVFNLALLTGLGLGGLVGIPILNFFKGRTFVFGPWTLNNFHCLFAIVVFLMIVAAAAVKMIPLYPTPEEDEAPLRQPETG